MKNFHGNNACIFKGHVLSLPFHILYVINFKHANIPFITQCATVNWKNNFWRKEVVWTEQIPCISVLIWVDSSMIVLYTKLKQQKQRQLGSNPPGEVLCFPLLVICDMHAFCRLLSMGKETKAGENVWFLLIIPICVSADGIISGIN